MNMDTENDTCRILIMRLYEYLKDYHNAYFFLRSVSGFIYYILYKKFN